MNFYGDLASVSLDFSSPFQVLGSTSEWASSFQMKPADIFAVSFKSDADQKEAVRQVLEGLKQTSNTWVSLRRFLQGALLTTCLIAVPAGVWAADDSQSAEKPAVAVSDSADTSTQDDKSPSATMPELTVIGASDKTKALTNSKYLGTLNETPQSATVVDQQQMQTQGITSMRDALRDVSGISLAAGEFSQQGDTLTVRGFSINHDFFLDGMRDYGSYYRDPFFLDRIEVLEGPSGLLFGDGTTGGVVNQVPKQPSLTPSIQGSLGFGADDNKRRATADINEPVPALGSDVALRLNVMTEQGNVSMRNVTQNTLGGIAPVLEFGIGTATRLTLSYLHENENSIPDYGIPWLLNNPAPVPQQNYYGYQDDYLLTSVDLESLKFEHDFDKNLLLKEQARYGNYYRNVRITEPQISGAQAAAVLNGSLALSNVLVNPNELAVYSTETSFDNQTDLLFKIHTAGIKHTFDVGAEEVIETSDPVRTTYTGVGLQPLLTPNENLSFSGTAAISSRTSASVTTLAGYAIDTIDLDQQWELIGGLRFDYINSVFNATGAAVTTASQAVTPLNWRAGLIYKPQPNSSIYFVSGTSTDPSAENLSLSSVTANLAPVQMTSFELGTKWGVLDNQLNLMASAFWDEENNAQVEDPNNPTNLIDAGTQRARGFTLGVQGYITKQWEVMTGYTFLDSTFLDFSTATVTGVGASAVTVISNFTGQPLKNAPQNTINFWTDYDLSDRFTVGGGFDLVTDRNGGKYGIVTPTTPGSYTYTGPLEDAPGYMTFSGMVKYNLDKNISIQANGSNLGNAYYIDQVHPGHIVPGAGRTVIVSTNFKF